MPIDKLSPTHKDQAHLEPKMSQAQLCNSKNQNWPNFSFILPNFFCPIQNLIKIKAAPLFNQVYSIVGEWSTHEVLQHRHLMPPWSTCESLIQNYHQTKLEFGYATVSSHEFHANTNTQYRHNLSKRKGTEHSIYDTLK